MPVCPLKSHSDPRKDLTCVMRRDEGSSQPLEEPQTAGGIARPQVSTVFDTVSPAGPGSAKLLASGKKRKEKKKPPSLAKCIFFPHFQSLPGGGCTLACQLTIFTGHPSIWGRCPVMSLVMRENPKGCIWSLGAVLSGETARLQGLKAQLVSEGFGKKNK